jgi:very-short-patch-repair endonuclease
VDPAVAAARVGGIIRTRELRSAGCTPAQVARAIERGELQRLRIGWLGLPVLSPDVVAAHRVGGRPACASIASAHGLWMLSDPGLHVEVPRHTGLAAVRGRNPGVTVHWAGTSQLHPRRGQPLDEALALMATCLPALEVLCSVDSALNRELVTLPQLRRLPGERWHRILDQADERAESGTETIFRFRARAAGYRPRTQVPVPGARIDFLLGERLVVEVDGSEFHSGREEFLRDRERDAWLAALGFYVVRLTYAQVVHRWHEVESLLRILHARGEQFGRRG